jgi:hypothetical protein
MSHRSARVVLERALEIGPRDNQRGRQSEQDPGPDRDGGAEEEDPGVDLDPEVPPEHGRIEREQPTGQGRRQSHPEPTTDQREQDRLGDHLPRQARPGRA